MHATFQLSCVAFARSTGGRVRLLLAVDRDGEPLFDGDPALLVEHRPGSAPTALSIDGPDQLDAAGIELVHAVAAEALVALVDAAFDDQGNFDGARILGEGPTVELPHGCLDV